MLGLWLIAVGFGIGVRRLLFGVGCGRVCGCWIIGCGAGLVVVVISTFSNTTRISCSTPGTCPGTPGTCSGTPAYLVHSCLSDAYSQPQPS